MSFIDKVESFISKTFHSLGALTDRLDTGSWIIISLVAVVAGLLIMKGSPVRGA